ncbi:hypothetical protein BC829DRAFT_469992 [Chytridium lagenaria]|nr:hypothetical protein BC829DRAFT_469992 [Chytridium lagenaria]
MYLPPITDVSYNSATGQCFCGTGLYLVDNTACSVVLDGELLALERDGACVERIWIGLIMLVFCVSGFVMDFGVDRPHRPDHLRQVPLLTLSKSTPPFKPSIRPSKQSSLSSKQPLLSSLKQPLLSSFKQPHHQFCLPKSRLPFCNLCKLFLTFLPTTLTTTLDNGTVLINTIPGIIVAVPIATPTTTLTPISTQSSSSPSPVLSNSAITITSVSVVAAITAVSACLFFVYRRRMKKMNAMNPNPPTGQSGEAVSTVTPSDTVFAADAKYPLQASSGTPVSVYMLDIKQPIPANATYETSQPVLLALKQPVSSGNVKTINGGAFKETAGAIERTRSEALPMYSEGDRQTVEATPIFLSKK